MYSWPMVALWVAQARPFGGLRLLGLLLVIVVILMIILLVKKLME
ncbi:MAG TPA: hypothetical protein VKZ59_11785 [Acidobacteriota bacterium]|nr:hypothetical protein [Acidobacteriota bacterium]